MWICVCVFVSAALEGSMQKPNIKARGALLRHVFRPSCGRLVRAKSRTVCRPVGCIRRERAVTTAAPS
uniref:Putative secreted protein n=1 Tax=Anopheles triannulatus TaxID=58253 RepID=A0A2M4B867_9DIPT